MTNLMGAIVRTSLVVPSRATEKLEESVNGEGDREVVPYAGVVVRVPWDDASLNS
jgi:hypothetical protein